MLSPLTLLFAVAVNARQSALHIHLSFKVRFSLPELIKTLEKCTKAKSRIEITRQYKPLHEPAILPSPQMKQIPAHDYYGGVLSRIKEDINTEDADSEESDSEDSEAVESEDRSSKESDDSDVEENEFQILRRVSASGKPISNEKLLEMISNSESKRIVLAGAAGFGKTTELKKLAQKLLDRSEEKEGESAKGHPIVHFIDAKKIIRKPLTTLDDMLFEGDIRTKNNRELLLQWFEENQSRIIILIDGLDQCTCDLKASHENGSTGSLMHNLMSGDILKDATVVMTSREHTITTLPEHARPDFIIALTGLEKQDAIQLISDLLQDHGNEARHDINNMDIITIPIYAIFTAIVLNYCARNKKKTPKYVTGLLAKILEIFIRSTQLRETDIGTLQKMMKMAYQGMEEGRMTFEVEHLKEHGLTREQVIDVMSEVPKETMHPGLLMEGDLILIFCHQTLQEFLAACYISKMDMDNFMSVIQNQFRGDWNKSHWLTVIQYLYGITFNTKVRFEKDIHQGTYKLFGTSRN